MTVMLWCNTICHIIIKSSTLKFLFQYITHSTLNQFINITRDTIKHYKPQKINIPSFKMINPHMTTVGRFNLISQMKTPSSFNTRIKRQSCVASITQQPLKRWFGDGFPLKSHAPQCSERDLDLTALELLYLRELTTWQSMPRVTGNLFGLKQLS